MNPRNLQFRVYLTNEEIDSLTNTRILQLQDQLDRRHNQWVEANVVTYSNEPRPAFTLDKDEFILAAYQDDVMVGVGIAVTLTKNFYNNSKYKELYINHFVIAARLRHQGIGNWLLNRILKYAKENKYTVAGIDVMAANSNAIGAYTKVGFKVNTTIYSKPIAKTYKGNTNWKKITKFDKWTRFDLYDHILFTVKNLNKNNSVAKVRDIDALSLTNNELDRVKISDEYVEYSIYRYEDDTDKLYISVSEVPNGKHKGFWIRNIYTTKPLTSDLLFKCFGSGMLGIIGAIDKPMKDLRVYSDEAILSKFLEQNGMAARSYRLFTVL